VLPKELSLLDDDKSGLNAVTVLIKMNKVERKQLDILNRRKETAIFCFP
jgi:hypothetical protein